MLRGQQKLLAVKRRRGQRKRMRGRRDSRYERERRYPSSYRSDACEDTGCLGSMGCRRRDLVLGAGEDASW